MAKLLPGGPTATINPGETAGFPDPYRVTRQKEEQLRRRRLAAQRLVEQSQQQLEGRTVRGTDGPLGQLPDIYVPPSWTELAAKGLQGYMGHQQMAELDREGAQMDTEATEAARAQAELEQRLKARDRDELWAREDTIAADKAEADRIAALSKQERDAIEADQKRQHDIELRRMPQLIESTSTRNTNVSGMGGGANGGTTQTSGTGFAGPATQVGIDPRTNAPVYRHTKTGNLFTYGEDGSATAHSGLVAPKPTSAQQTAAGEGRHLAGDVDAALTEVETNPDAFGFKTYLPDVALQRIDPEGVNVRAQVGKLASAQIKDMSGAAVSAHEQKRLNSFLPAAGDNPATVQIKLKNYKDELARKGYSVAPQQQGASGNWGGATPAPAAKKVVREVRLKDGRIGVEYSDGSRGYK